METILTFLLVLQVLVSVALIGFILIQHGKGADAGAAFGSGASSTVFGSRGSGNFMTKVTTILVIIFLANSLMLTYISNQTVQTPTSLLDSEPGVVLPQTTETPDTDIPEQDATSDIPQDMLQDMQEVIPAESATAPVTDIPDVPAQ
jgi:preprotein translocase subunit SecG